MTEVKKVTKVRAKAPAKVKAPKDAPPTEVYASEFSVGDDIKHPQFGTGVVLEITGEKLQIRFADERERQVLDYYVVRG